MSVVEVIGYQGKRKISLCGHMDSQSQADFFLVVIIHFWFDLVCFRSLDDV